MDRRALWLFAFSLIACLAPSAHAEPRLSIESALALDPSSVAVAIKLDDETESVPGLQFEVRYSSLGRGPLKFERAEQGDAITGQSAFFTNSPTGLVRATILPDAQGTPLRAGTVATIIFSLAEATASPVVYIQRASTTGQLPAPIKTNGFALIVLPDLADTDSDHDGVSDGDEVAQGTHPLLMDTVPATIETPVMAPNGGNFDQSVLIAMSSPTQVAKIWYTTNGADPVPNTRNTVLYTGPIRLTRSTVVKAVAAVVAPDGKIVASAVTPPQSYQVAVYPYVAPPKIESDVTTVPASNVTIATTTEGASIYYTVDRTMPSPTNGKLYTGPLIITSPLTLKAVAVKDGYRNSEIASAVFREDPTRTPAVNTAPEALPTTIVAAPNASSFGMLPARDADADALTYTVADLPLNGSVEISPQTGEFRYTPVTDYTGGDSFSFRVNDGAADSNTAVVTIDVAGSDVPPIARLRVSSDGRHFEQDNGEPFFWSGDANWGMSSLSPGEIASYLRDRAERGFNAVIGPTVQLQDWTEEYLSYLDRVVDEAARNGLYIALPVTWEAEVSTGGAAETPDTQAAPTGNPFELARVLAQRFSARPNVVWVLAGESNPIAEPATEGADTIETSEDSASQEAPTADEAEQAGPAVIAEVARGLKEGSDGNNLLSAKPASGASPSAEADDQPGLDFVFVKAPVKNVDGRCDTVANAWSQEPAKPIVALGPEFTGATTSEKSPDTNVDAGTDLDTDTDPAAALAAIEADVVRRLAYSCTLQGASGFSYGNGLVWSVAPTEEQPELIDPLQETRSALQLLASSSRDARYLRRLIESRPLATRAPDPELSFGDQGLIDLTTSATGARASDGSYAFVYFPAATLAQYVNLYRLSGTAIAAWWYNPRDGRVYADDGRATGDAPFANFASSQTVAFDPPGDLETDDWILILDSANEYFSAPGDEPSPSPVGDQDISQNTDLEQEQEPSTTSAQ